MSEHIVSIKVYLLIFLALMVGTALTVWAGLQDFPGQLNVIVALTIAVIKATLVVLYFMHVRYSSRLIWVVFTSALFWGSEVRGQRSEVRGQNRNETPHTDL